MSRKLWWVAGVLLCTVPGSVMAQSVNMGSTFHDLEGRAERVVATFDDAEVETRRDRNGAWRATLRDGKGRVRAELTGQRGHRAVQFRAPGRDADAHAFELADATDVGLDWAAIQAYASWTDTEASRREGRPFDPSAAQWDGHVRRDMARGRGGSAAQLAARIRRVRTTFPEVDITATLDVHDRAASKRRVDYSKFTARVKDRRTGRDRGFIRWFDTAQVVTWKIEGGGAGVILPDRLPEGWTFTPTMAWANVQAYYFATRPQHVDPGAPVARRLGDLFGRPGPQSALGQVAWLSGVSELSQALPWRTALPAFGALGAAAAMAFNEPGCDNLHWLDSTIFRVCCDRHDQCYEKSGCSASSWRWPFSGSWQCASCNAQAVWCFCTLANPYHCGGSGGGGGGSDDSSGDCQRASGGFCPVECATCIAS
jgi:hypothetical protein